MKTQVISTYFLIALAGCGKPSASGDGEASSGDHNQKVRSASPTALRPIKSQLDTIVLNLSQLPGRYNGDPLTLTVASNDPAAQFDCRQQPQRDFIPCASDRQLRWESFVHGQAVTMDIRARVGTLEDDTPVRVAFVVDRIAGQGLLPQAARPSLVFDPSVGLPQADQPQDSSGPSIPRTVPLGSHAAVVVPPHLSVTSYSTMQSTDGELQVVFDPEVAVLASSCRHSWEALREQDGCSPYAPKKVTNQNGSLRL